MTWFGLGKSPEQQGKEGSGVGVRDAQVGVAMATQDGQRKATGTIAGCRGESGEHVTSGRVF